ncbi:uncharacterized protein UTRI_02329 [Ustilago trichophora]|uniref:Uncharacterized protein n=1 Tax=Ustilago trichophora TaxID=86804 RepID=A0A5C3E7K5_9BASI|nr:uncharacterized protein UTRI_02329 [Ustilago trichophora]
MQYAMRRKSEVDRLDPAGPSNPPANRSYVPASLGIGTPNTQSRSLSERLRLSRNASSSSSASKSKSSSDGLQFSNANPAGRNAGEFGSFPSIPSWGPQSSNSFANPPNGLSTSSSTGSLGSTSSSRNFLVPIGATGARQKLSIANASHRRRLAASEDAKWSTDSPTGQEGPQQQQHHHQQQQQQQQQKNEAGLHRSQSDFYSLAALDGPAGQDMSRSSSAGFFASGPSSATSNSIHNVPKAGATPAELVQQAAMQRLSSQRILPTFKNRSVSENLVGTSHSSRTQAPSISGSPVLERDQPSPSVRPVAPVTATATERRTDPTVLAARTATVTVPDRTASSLGPTYRSNLPAPPTSVDEIPSRLESQRHVDLVDRDVDRSIASKPLTLAESYKRAMLERDAERAKTAARAEIALPKSASTASAASQASAPTLDLDLPASSFFFDDDQSETSSSFTARPAPAATARNEAPNSPKTRTHHVDINSSSTDTTPVKDSNSKRIAALANASPTQSGSDLPSLQKSYDEAMAIQDRIRQGISDEPAYGGLFDSGASPFARRSKEDGIARSYLALGDDDDETSDHKKHQTTDKQNAAADATATVLASSRQPAQIQHQGASALPKAPTLASKPPTTPPADKSFVQFSTPEDEDLAIAPNKFETQPGPREEAALQAGATAAATASPLVAAPETHVSKQSSLAASPAINGERTVQPTDEGADGMRWRRSQDALAALSPLQQSRFSEASTDLSDSRAPTRNENRYSGRASSISSGDGLEEESSDGHMLPTSAWQEVENALRRFRDKATSVPADRGNLLRAVLLPFLALEAETATVDVVGSGVYVKGKARRALFFDWIRSLLLELQHVQTSADRGAILESIACIIESRNFSASILSTDPEDEARFSSVFGHILSYAIGELNKKGVYQNTLIFSGRLLAVAFFRVNGVASKLLRALPVNRFALERVAREFDWQRKRPVDFERFVNRFPATLRQLCYKDSREYLKMLDSESIAGASNGSDPQAAEDDRFLVCQPEVEVEMSGNWLRRWQSDDSELFFSFCRSYHRQLASLFASSKSLESVSKYFLAGPDTPIWQPKNFNPAGETANVLSGSTAGKPRILEAANRRCTAIVVDIVRAPAGTNMIFAPMLGLHIKALIKRTSLYDVQGVFCLLDWLDGVISHMDSNDLINEGLVDISFIITTIGMLLENADHALALMRTIAFCYANFGVLTATTENRIYFCEQILLKPNVFHKLFLSWSFTIRAYYLHLLVFRLARIRDFPAPRDDPTGRTAVRVVRLFNQRLEALRKRHDSLSPEIDSSSDDTKSEDSKSRKSGTSTFISTIKRASSEGAGSEGSVEGRPKAEKIMGMTAVAAPTPKVEIKKSSHSKTKSWLKAFRSGSKQDVKGDSGRGATSPRSIGAFSPTTGKVTSPESDDDSKTIGSSRTTPRTSFESTSSDAMSDVSTLAGSVRGARSSKSSGAFEFDIKQQQASQQQQQQQQSRSASQATANSGSAAAAANANAVLTPTHDAGIAKDTVFDLQSAHAHHPPTPGRTPQSPRVSKAFSRRASMLPGPASELVASLMEGEGEEVPPVPDLPLDQVGLGLSGMINGNSIEVYDETLHIYAVQSLREYEQTVQEHDEFFASLPEDQSAQVPRLPVNWPAMWSSTGE